MDPNKGSRAADELREAWRPDEGRRPADDRRHADVQRPTRRQPPGRATFHLPADLLDEMRNAVVALAGPPHRLTMSKLAANALRRELDRLRDEQRGSKRGKAFRQRAGQVTRGRPVR